MKEKQVHVVYITAYQLVFARGTPHEMLWCRHSGCFVITFRDENRIMINIPISSILRWIEYDVEVSSEEQKGAQAAQATRRQVDASRVE